MVKVRTIVPTVSRKWCSRYTIAAGGIFFAVLLSGCKTLLEAQKQATQLEYDLHARMTSGDLAGIYAESDPGYKSAITREKSDALFTAIARKLGTPLECTPGGINISATTSGAVIRSECTTTFSKSATGTETFVWRNSSDRYRLLGYNINSNELVER